MAETRPAISKPALERVVRYLHYVKALPADGPPNISATFIAEALALNQVQVRKDLACVCSGGRPKTGYLRRTLVRDIEHFLGYDNLTDAVVVGVGNLGKALMAYNNFTAFGLNIVAGFDADPEKVGSEVCGKKIFDVNRVANLCRRLNARIGLITVPADKAQDVCALLVKGGIRAIWNFSPANLTVPASVAVKNESLAASFTVLSRMLAKSFETHGFD